MLKKATILRQGYGRQASDVLGRSASSRTAVRPRGFAPAGVAADLFGASCCL